MPSRPSDTEYAPYFAGYVALVPESDVLSVLETQVTEIAQIARTVPLERQTYRYAHGKWSIREVFGHLIDCDRLFGYRAFCISRGEATPLPSMDEDAYVAGSSYHERTLADLLAEFKLIRNSNIALLNPLSEADWKRMGTAGDNPVSVRALAYMMAGHVRHHLQVLRTIYLK